MMNSSPIIRSPAFINLGSRYETRIDQQIRLLDSQSLTLGTDGDASVYNDGTNTFIDLRVGGGTGNLMIALAGSFPSPDANAVHIWQGTAGTVDANTDAALIIEDSNDVKMEFLVPAANSAGFRIGVPSPGSNNEAQFIYSGPSHGSVADTWRMFADETELLRTSAATLDMRVAGMDLDINAGFIQLAEMTAPGAGAADHVRIYAEDGGGGLTDLSAVFQDGTIVDFAEEATPLDAPIHVTPSGTAVTLEFRKPHPGISEINVVFPDGGTHCLWRARFHDTEKIAANAPGADARLPDDWFQESARVRKARADTLEVIRLRDEFSD